MAKNLRIYVGDFQRARAIAAAAGQSLAIISQGIETGAEMVCLGAIYYAKVSVADREEHAIFCNVNPFLAGVRLSVARRHLAHDRVQIVIVPADGTEPVLVGLNEFGDYAVEPVPEALSLAEYAATMEMLNIKTTAFEAANESRGNLIMLDEPVHAPQPRFSTELVPQEHKNWEAEAVELLKKGQPSAAVMLCRSANGIPMSEARRMCDLLKEDVDAGTR